MSEEVIGEVDTAQAESNEVQQEESATSEKAETEDSKETEGEAEQSEEKPRKPGAEKRIAQLTWQLKEQERKFQALESRLNQPKPSEPLKERPTLESVGFDEGKYTQAMEEYLSSQIESKVDSTLTAKQQAETSRKAQEELTQKTSDFFRKGIELADDFAEVISDESLPVTESMRDALYSVDKGPEILYQLAQNPAELHRIAGLPPYAQAVEIGRLEARMSMPQPKKTSSAPNPLKPLNAGGESASKHPDKMTMKEYAAWRQSQG